MLEDPSGYGRVVRAPDGTVERVVETKAPGDATELELHIREINTGMFAFEGGALLAALARGRAPTTPRASTTCPTCCRSCARTSGRSLAYELGDPTETLGINDRAAAGRRSGRSRSGGSTSATCSPG